MDFFFENPWKFIIVGALVEIGLLALIVKTGRGMWLFWMAGVAVIAAALVLVERLVVTDRERVEIALYDAAAAAESNDINAVLPCVSPTAPVRDKIRSELPKYHIDKVSIKDDLKITVNNQTSPPSAVAEFHVVVTGGDRRGNVSEMSIPLSFVVHFERDKDRWLISGYEEHMLQGL